MRIAEYLFSFEAGSIPNSSKWLVCGAETVRWRVRVAEFQRSSPVFPRNGVTNKRSRFSRSCRRARKAHSLTCSRLHYPQIRCIVAVAINLAINAAIDIDARVGLVAERGACDPIEQWRTQDGRQYQGGCHR